jgi:hypothetical protein
VLVAMVVMLAMSSPALAAPGGNGQSHGQGGGYIAHADNGNHKANGGGTSNNPHNGCFSC